MAQAQGLGQSADEQAGHGPGAGQRGGSPVQGHRPVEVVSSAQETKAGAQRLAQAGQHAGQPRPFVPADRDGGLQKSDRIVEVLMAARQAGPGFHQGRQIGDHAGGVWMMSGHQVDRAAQRRDRLVQDGGITSDLVPRVEGNRKVG